MALDAEAVIAGPAGTRTVKVTEVPTGPGSTSLAAGEMLVAFRIPTPPAGSSAEFRHDVTEVLTRRTAAVARDRARARN